MSRCQIFFSPSHHLFFNFQEIYTTTTSSTSKRTQNLNLLDGLCFGNKVLLAKLKSSWLASIKLTKYECFGKVDNMCIVWIPPEYDDVIYEDVQIKFKSRSTKQL